MNALNGSAAVAGSPLSECSSEADMGDGCPICLEAFGRKAAVSTECGHTLHLSCLRRCFSGAGGDYDCPICRRSLQVVVNLGLPDVSVEVESESGSASSEPEGGGVKRCWEAGSCFTAEKAMYVIAFMVVTGILVDVALLVAGVVAGDA